MKILIVDNNMMRDSWGASELVGHARQLTGATVWVRRGPHSDLPSSPEGFDRVILSGSLTRAMDLAPWVIELDRFVRRAVDLSIPLLGVCYGHQTLHRALGGLETVRQSQVPEYGWTQIRKTGPSRLLLGLSPLFYSYSSHQDEVASPLKELEVTACSDDCAIQAVEMKSKPVFGIQFHPEKVFKTAELYDETVGQAIFSNFLRETSR